MTLEKRTYETRAVRELTTLLASHRAVLAVGPTGCGKTVIGSMLIHKRPGRVLWLAHKYELIDQAHRSLTSLGIDAGVWMAHEERLHGAARVDSNARVQVASIQTAARRGVAGSFDLVVIDEAHRAMADSYQKVAGKHPNAKILGLTATPCRQDGRGLGSFFDEMFIVATPSELYEDGYLAKPRTFAAPQETVAKIAAGLRRVRSVHGEYNPKELERLVDTQLLVGNVVSESLRLAPGVPKVVFAASVAHSKRIAKRFQRRGIKVAHVDGETPADERAEILASLETGKVEVVCNVDVLSEGWDLPKLGAVVIARPTKSLARFLQMCGRVQRPYKGRTPIILDHGNNVLRHGVLPSQDIEWSLDEDTEHGEKSQPIFYACAECFTFAPITASSCPECGADRPIGGRERKMQEENARLEEVTQTRIAEMHARIEKLAEENGAPRGWSEKVLAECLQ
jgi:DNA repair protein RadD